MQTALRLMAALGAVLAPAMTAQLALVQSAYAQAVSAQAAALPPPPYARTAQTAVPSAPVAPTRYSGMQAYDRYGGEARRAPAVVQASTGPSSFGPSAAGQAPAFTGSRLSWSGKVDVAPPPAQSARAMPYAYAQGRGAYLPTGYAASAPGQPPQPQSAGAPRGWTFVPPIGQPAANAPAPVQPNSIYDPPPPAQQQPAPAAPSAIAQSQADGGPHHYSVHRDYGIEPDPIPLPPQFFGATADLSQPATADPIRRTVTANGKTQNPLQPTDGQ